VHEQLTSVRILVAQAGVQRSTWIEGYLARGDALTTQDFGHVGFAVGAVA
jgi:hypothetical protein